MFPQVKAMSLTESLEEALKALDSKPEDQAAIQLARVYAAHLDGGNADLVKEGPLLLSVLDALGMTPRARAAVMGKGGGNGAAGAGKLDELRDRRRARRNDAPPVDSSAS
jgi:hypothetical protein